MSNFPGFVRLLRCVAVVLATIVVGAAYLAANFGAWGKMASHDFGDVYVLSQGWPLLYHRYQLFVRAGQPFNYAESLERENFECCDFAFDTLLVLAVTISVAPAIWSLTSRRWDLQTLLCALLLFTFWSAIVLDSDGSSQFAETKAVFVSPHKLYVLAIGRAWWMTIPLLAGVFSVIFVAGRLVVRLLEHPRFRPQSEVRPD